MELIGGRYWIENEVGRGGFATVYRAIDTKLDRAVALKVLRLDDAFPLSVDRRLEREVAASAGLAHPNLIVPFDHGRDGVVRWLAMELFEGELLRARIDRGPLPCHEALEIAGQLLAALAYLHERERVHRDVKPTNVLLVPGHAGPVVKLLDFGVGRRADDLEEDVALAATAGGIGTPGYLAPERVCGLPDGPPADVYGAGAVLYEMLAGRAPFGGSDEERLFSTLEGHVPPLAWPVPLAIDAIVRTALARYPDARYRDGRAFAEALERVRPHQAFVVAAPTAPRRPWVAVAAAALLLTLATACVGAWASGRVAVSDAGPGKAVAGWKVELRAP